MSLVDYASSSEDEGPEPKEEKENEAKETPKQVKDSSSLEESQPSVPQNQRLGSSSNQNPASSVNATEPVIEKLPDVSLLLNSPSITPYLSSCSNHSSRVAAAMAENASRKRDANASAPPSLRSKVPRGTLPPSRNIPDTQGGVLVPPQLRGRSNVVTEDIGKLFVQKRANTPSHQISE